jgi:hypothetical protein
MITDPHELALVELWNWVRFGNADSDQGDKN